VGVVVGKGLGLMPSVHRIGRLAHAATCLALAASALKASADDARKPTLAIAPDDGPQSQMLRSELTRDWTRPNPAIRLTRSQKKELETRGKELNASAAKIASHFRIVYVKADETPLSIRFHLPAVRTNRGAWETLDRRAFAFSGRPLMTLEWYRARRVAIAADNPRPVAIPYWDYCSAEGFSGDVDVEDACAPWDFGNKFVTYQDAARRAAPCPE
jgi:hypothetical protein